MTIAQEVAAELLLAETLDGYAGQWVAVREHRVVADAPTLEELLERIVGGPVDVELFQVASDPHAICCF